MIPASTLRSMAARLSARFALVALAGAHSLHAAPATWRMLETPRFTVISQLRDKPTREWMEEFNQFTEELRLAFRVERPHVPPLTVVLFARDRDFARYKPLRPDGRGPAPIAGFFNHHGNWSVIGLAGGYSEEGTRELIFHEGVHWFTSADPVAYPLWLSEGLAEVFSTFRQEKGKVRWGTAVPAHVVMLREQAMLPFERFLYLTHDDPLFNRSHRTGIYYAQSWVFVHYLMFGAHGGSRDTIARYFELLGAGTHPDDAFVAAFGQDYTAMAATLASYIRTGQYEMRLRPESPTARITAAPRPAPAATVEVALARLALAAERDDVARPHAERAVALAPELPGGYEMLAQVQHRAGHTAAALASCLRAEQAGSQDASTLFLLAYLSSASESVLDGDAAQARVLANLYRRVIAACPTMEEAYQNLAGLAPVLETVEREDVAALKQGARLFPRRGEILLGLASLAECRGDRDSARALLQEARKRGLPVDAERNATRIEDGWLYGEATARIEALLSHEQFAAALDVCDEAIARVTDIYSRAALVRVRQDLSTRARMHHAERTLRAGDVAAARALYEALLADATVPAQMRRAIEHVLGRLPVAIPAAGDAVTP